MNFHRYEPILTGAKRVAKLFPQLPKLTRHDILSVLNDRTSGSMQRLHAHFDTCWEVDRRPYYRIYPSLISMLTRLNLEKVRGCDISLPRGLRCLSVQFPLGHELHDEVRTMWIDHVDLDPAHGTTRGISIGLDHGEEQNSVPVYLIRCFPLKETESIEESLDALPVSASLEYGKQLDDAIIRDAVRIACTVCLIGDDPELVRPEVLSKDEHRVNEDNVDSLVERARRRGKIGWTLGKSIEVIPHYRRPHPALVWTGTGRKIPKIVMRSGSLVHREAVVAVPTGYGDD